MDNQQAQKTVNRICAGKVRIGGIQYKGEPHTLIVASPNAEIRYEADDIYAEALEESRSFGVFSSNECVLLAMDRGYWDEDKETKLEKIPLDIEEMKVLIFENFNKPSVRDGVRKNLRAAEKSYADLYSMKYKLDHWSAEHLAKTFSMQYVLSKTIFLPSGKPIIGNFWKTPFSDAFLLYLMGAVNRVSITEAEYRYVVRNEPWRSLWAAGKTSFELFGLPAAHMSYEQRQAINWARLYDVVAESADRPETDVIVDDDALDGWIIKQNRERSEELKQESSKNYIKNEKIKNAGEVYIVAKPEDVKSIHNMNSNKAKMIKKERRDALNRQGEILEQHMPDVRRDLMMKINQAAKDSIKRRGR